MVKYILILFFLQCSLSSVAQKEANNWYFGAQAHLNFDACVPIATDRSAMGSYDASVSISHPKTGELLFYSNAEQVWNRTHQLMPHGDSLKGSSSVTQGVLAVPVPGDSSQYYLFTLAEPSVDLSQEDSLVGSVLSYCLIDMTLDQGRGDVKDEAKNSVLAKGLTGKLTAIAHANGQDYWLLVHRWNSDEFIVYQLTSAGIIDSATYAIGSRHVLNPKHQGIPETQGYLRASPDGKKLASAVASNTPRPFDLFDFDASTGVISNYVNLGNVRTQHGVSFSPDNTKLYVTTGQQIGSALAIELIRQYDLAAGSTADILASGQSVVYGNPTTNIPQSSQIPVIGNYIFALQIGPDGKIYGPSDYDTSEGSFAKNFLVIQQPNAKGFACDIQIRSLNLGDGLVGNFGGLPNFIQTPFNGLEPRQCTDSTCQQTEIAVFPNPTRDDFQIRVNQECFQPFTLVLYDVLGHALFSKNVETALSNKIATGTLANGLYLVAIRFPEQTLVKKVVINR